MGEGSAHVRKDASLLRRHLFRIEVTFHMVEVALEAFRSVGHELILGATREKAVSSDFETELGVGAL